MADNIYIQGKKSYYKGFLIIEYPEGTLNAYRCMYYLEVGIASYSSWHCTSIETIQAFIDVAEDCGCFTPEQLDDMLVQGDGHKDEFGILLRGDV